MTFMHVSPDQAMIPRVLQGLTVLYVLFMVLLVFQIMWADYAQTLPAQVSVYLE